MEDSDLHYELKECGTKDLRGVKVLEFIQSLKGNDFSSFLKCAKGVDEPIEVVYFEVQPELGQRSINDIRYIEPLAVVFDINDRIQPEVFALREGFPVLRHLNLGHFEKPRSLCLYEVAYSERKRTWTAVSFLNRIREWLSQASMEELHLGNQPLEHFFIEAQGVMILPSQLPNGGMMCVASLGEFDKSGIVRAFVTESIEDVKKGQFEIIFAQADTQLHGYLNKAPSNAFELQLLLAGMGFSLRVDGIKKKLDSIDLLKDKAILNRMVFVIISVPLCRNLGDAPEVNDTTSFLLKDTLKDLGKGFGLIDEVDGVVAKTLFVDEVVDREVLESIKVYPFRTYLELDFDSAQGYSGVEKKAARELMFGQIGVGALGSQLLMTLVRMGLGAWRIVDNDILLPHNLVRHSLLSSYVGFPKVIGMEAMINDIYKDQGVCKGINADYLNLGRTEEAFYDHFEEIDILVDTSASVAVGRKLAFDDRLKGRRLSVFLNPSGDALVMMLEPVDRRARLDQIEMQYYRELWRVPSLKGHLSSPEEVLRYSGSCRDITNVISEDKLMVFSGIAAKSIVDSEHNQDGQLSIHQLQHDGSVARLDREISCFRELEIDGWTLSIDSVVDDLMNSERMKKLPNETGGILIGSVDREERVIYIVDTIISPEDSREYPNAYYRGINGVEQMLTEVSLQTSGNLHYIGEWHSHPKGAGVERSQADLKLFEWIINHLGSMGLPGVMLIVGDDKIGHYVGAC